MFNSLDDIKTYYTVEGLNPRGVEMTQKLVKPGVVRVTLRDAGHSVMESEFETGPGLDDDLRDVLTVDTADRFINEARRKLWLS